MWVGGEPAHTSCAPWVSAQPGERCSEPAGLRGACGSSPAASHQAAQWPCGTEATLWRCCNYFQAHAVSQQKAQIPRKVTIHVSKPTHAFFLSFSPNHSFKAFKYFFWISKNKSNCYSPFPIQASFTYLNISHNIPGYSFLGSWVSTSLFLVFLACLKSIYWI